MKKKKQKTLRPSPPADVSGVALAEWDRVCTELEAMDRPIKPADTSILTLYVRTWEVNCLMYDHIRQFGAIIKWSNGTPGPSPQYKTYIETAKVLRGLLEDMGCTPASRDFDVVPDEKPEPLGEMKF